MLQKLQKPLNIVESVKTMYTLQEIIHLLIMRTLELYLIVVIELEINKVPVQYSKRINLSPFYR